MSDAADFAARFTAYWREPTVEGLDALLAPDARFVAPLTATTETLAEGKRVFARLLRLAPDLHAEVHAWGGTKDGLLIEFTVSGTVAGVPVSWPAVDRIVLRDDGLASERFSYFDSAPLVGRLARHPRTWLPFLRTRLAR